MPTLFGRRYARRIEAVGTGEKALGVLILLLVAGLIAVFVVQVARDRGHLFDVARQGYAAAPPGRGAAGPPATRGANPFPEAGLTGWRKPARAERYGAEELYVKIDGRAEAYRALGVVGLVFGRYQYADDPARAVDVYWYDMATPAAALRAYHAEQPPDAAPLALGEAGYQAGAAVFFCRGSSYVQLLPARPDEADGAAALQIARRLAQRIGQN